ncbi:MAG: MlaD family protein [Solirubrobacteraceae bacterium]
MNSRRLGWAALLAALVGIVLLLDGGNGTQHRLFVDVSQATNIIPGQNVREGGIVVGSVGDVEPIDRGRAARVELDIAASVWPIPQGSTFTVKWGGTITYANRQIELQRGPSSAPSLADGALLSAAAFRQPVEFDQLIGTFTPSAQASIKSFLDNAGAALRNSTEPLQTALQEPRTPAALQQASAVTEDFNLTSSDLNGLIVHGERVIAAVQSANPGLGQLIEGTAGTFQAIATDASGVQATLANAPATLTSVRTTLDRAQRTLSLAGALAQRLSPGVTQLRAIATPLADTLQTLAVVGPDGASTLQTLRSAAPQINPFVDRVIQTMAPITAIGRSGTAAMKCIRPYSPEVAGFFSNWDGFTAYDDGRNKYVRLMIQGSPYPSGTPLNAATLQKALPQLRYAFPRPPGYNGGQPWFQPQCGAGRSALNASTNPMDGYTGGGTKTLVGTNPAPQAQP